jgi:hypothetical protein
MVHALAFRELAYSVISGDRLIRVGKWRVVTGLA